MVRLGLAASAAAEWRDFRLLWDKLSSEEHGIISSLRQLVLLATDTYHLEVHWEDG